MVESVVCVFPHSRDEFETPQLLDGYLLQLKKERGRYLAHNFRRTLDKNFKSRVVTRSIVLFRKGNVVVGQAEVQREIQKLSPPVQAPNGRGILTTYETDLVFAPDSIEIYEPYKPVAQFEEIRGRRIPQHYYAIICTRKEYEERFGAK
jgi:hypothetical protein